MFSSLNFMPTVKVPFSRIFFGPEIFQTIYTCFIINILSLWLNYKKKVITKTTPPPENTNSY